MKIQCKLKLKILFFSLLFSLGNICFDLRAFSNWSIPYQSTSQDWSQAPTKSAASNALWHNRAPSLCDHMKDHVTLHVEQKHASSLSRSQQDNLWLEIKLSAHYLMNYDPDVSRIHQHIKQECASMLHVLQKGTTYDHLQMFSRMQMLETAFDKHEQALQIKADQLDRSLCSQEFRDVVAFQLQVTRYLKQELHNMIGSVQGRLSTSDGTFLGRMQSKLIHLLKTCLGVWTPEGIIRAYLKQYNGQIIDMPVPDAAHVDRIAQNGFNRAIQELDICLKYGDLNGAHKVMQDFASNKQQHKLMLEFKDLSPHFNSKYGIPTCWHANPKWSTYQKMLSSNKCDIKQTEQIKRTLQQEHMQAQELCRQSGINEPTTQQLNQAHQLQKYHADPNFSDLACKGLQQSASTNAVLDTLEQRSNMLHKTQALLDDKTVLPTNAHAYYQSREQALQKMAQGDLSVCIKEYSLSPQATQVLKQAGSDPEQFTSCKGNLVQQDNHAKLVSSLNQLAQRSVRTQAAQQIKDGVLDCAQAGNALNQLGSLKEAMLMSDVCHVAVDHIWHFIDSGVSVGAGFSEGLMQGVATFYNTEIAANKGESTISACNESQPNLRTAIRAETAETVHELLTLIRDIGEVGLEVGYGIKDSYEGMKQLPSALVDITKGAGNCLATMGVDTLMLLDAAERRDLYDFAQHLDKMKADCHQIKEGIQTFATQLGAHINAHMPQDGQITKAHAKMAVRTGAHMLTDGFVMNLGMKGVSSICKGVSNHLAHVSKDLSRIKEIKDLSLPEIRKALLIVELERSPLASQMPALHNSTVWEQVVKDQATMLKPVVEAASSLKTIEGAIKTTLEPQQTMQTVKKAADASQSATKVAGALSLVKQVENAVPFARKSIDDLIKDATFLRKTSGNTRIYELKGGYERAKADFESLCPKNIRTIPISATKETIVGQLENGVKVNVRNHSSYDKIPTLELRLSKNKIIKLRYN